jgi:hypothetical protein
MPSSLPTRTRAVSPALHAPLAMAVAATLLLQLPSVADAQQRRDWPPQHRHTAPQLSIEAGGLFSTHRGSALGEVSDGTGFDVMGSIGSGMFSLGGGYQRQSHRRAGDGDAVVSGAFIEPRLATPFAVGNFTPYLFARGARLTRRVSGGTAERTVSGTAIGGGLGTLFWLAPNIQLNTSLLWQDLRFERAAEVSIPELPRRVNGAQWGLRAGVVVGFDHWGR